MDRFLISAFADEIDKSLDMQMDVLEEFGVSYIEMRGVEGKGIVDYTLDEVEKIKARLDKRGFKVSAVGSPLGKIGIKDDFEPHKELFRHTMKIAGILETKHIRMFSFYIPKGEDPSNYRDEVLRRWRWFADEAEGSGLLLCHENEKGIYGDTPERCLDLLETIGRDHVRAVFDPANFIQCDVETYPKAFNMLRKHLEYMHIKDALYEGHSVVPSGAGDGHVKEIIEALYKDGFEGILSLEPHLAAFDGFAQLEPDADVSRMAKGGPQQFAVAFKALKKILDNIDR